MDPSTSIGKIVGQRKTTLPVMIKATSPPMKAPTMEMKITQLEKLTLTPKRSPAIPSTSPLIKQTVNSAMEVKFLNVPVLKQARISFAETLISTQVSPFIVSPLRIPEKTVLRNVEIKICIFIHKEKTLIGQLITLKISYKVIT
jgi:hypothetical protein